MSGYRGDYLIELGRAKSTIYVLLLGNRLRLEDKNLTFCKEVDKNSALQLSLLMFEIFS